MNDLIQQLAPGWSPVNIALIVILFMMSWPLGLLMIAYVIWGEKLELDLGKPETLRVFGKRLAVAWRAAIDSFSK